MKESHPYRCGVCGKPRSSDANHWWLIWIAPLCDGWRKRIEIQSWHDSLAAQSGVEHICGQACLITKTSQLAEEVKRTEIAPTAEGAPSATQKV